MGTADFLLAELERLFELDGMKNLSTELMGLDPAELGGTGGKGAFARALVERCAAEHALEALADAIASSAPGGGARLAENLPSDGAELLPEAEVGGFRVLKRLGKGPLASVYLAERQAPSNGHTERAALKVFDATASRDRTALWRFLTRTRVLRGVRATGLAQIFEAGILPDGRPWVASEYVAGQNLAQRLGRTGPVHFNEIRLVARSVLRGLEKLHAEGLTHGNLKAENVLLVRPGQDDEAEAYGVLLDAGQSRLLESSLPASGGVLHVVGSPHAIAPERLEHAPESPRSEVYAMGALLYQALAGRPPFEGRSDFEVLAAHLMEVPEPPSAHAPDAWIPEELDAVVLRALSKDPADRYASAGQLADALEAVGRSLFPPAADAEVDEVTFVRAVEAVRGQPGDASLAASLEAMVEPSREWQQAVDAFLETAEECEDADAKKALLFRSARILDQEMRDPEAAEQVYRSVLALDPDDAHAHNSIEELRRARGDHEGLIELLLDRLESESVPATRAGMLREVASLYAEELDSPDSAQVAWTQVLLEEPDDERAKRALERLLRTPEQWQEVLGTLHEGLEDCEDRPTAQQRLYTLLGTWWDTRLNRADVAVPYLEHALRLDPASDTALEAMTRLYERSQSWTELAQILLHRADATASAAVARDLRCQAARVQLEHLGEAAQATTLLQDVVAEDASHPQATVLLRAELERAEDWPALARMLEAQASELRGEARCEALCQLAEIHEVRLDDPAEAERQLLAALEAHERSLEALKALERVRALRGDHMGMLEVIERQVGHGTTPNQRIALLLRASAILEEDLEDAASAVEWVEQVIELAPGHDAANTALARLYRKLQRFDDLAQTLDRHAKGAEEPERKAQLLMQAARVLMGDLGSPERAAFMCARVLGLVADHPEALELNARIRALGGDTLAAVDAIEVMADTEPDAERKAELWVRAGRHLEDADDLDGAIERYQQALEAAPASPVAIAALQRVYERRGDVHGEAEVLLRQVELCEDDAERARKLVALGSLRQERLRDDRLAADAFERAVELDPDNLEASLGLGLIALAAQQWESAVSRLTPLMDHGAELGSRRAFAVCLGVGDAQRELGDDEAAEQAYLRAKEQAPADPKVLDRLASVALSTGKYEEAAQILRGLLAQQEQSLSTAERAELLLSLALAQHAGGSLDDAVQTLQEALTDVPGDADLLSALASVHRDRQDWKAVAEALAAQLDVCEEASERFDLYVETGDLFAGELADRARASEAYVAALELRADDRNLLAKLMSVYSEDKDWSKLVAVLERMASVVDEPAVRAKYLVTAGSLVLRELSDHGRAAALYEQALSFDPHQPSAFKGLAESLSRASSWKALAAAYRNHIERTQADAGGEQQASLWDNLAQVLHYRLDRIDEAVFAYQRAQELDPEDRQRLERLAEIYGRHPSRYTDEAVHTHAALLRNNPYRMESYQALRKLYTHVERLDEAWCVCQALRALNVAEPDEEAFFKRHRVAAAATASECATDELWRELIVHPEQDPLLTRIFAMVTPAAIATTTQPLEAFGTDAQHRIDAASSEYMMPQMLAYASGMTLLPLPEVYYRPQDPGGLSFLFTAPAAIGVGQASLADTPDQAVAFFAGRHLSYYRSGHYMRQLVPTGSGLRGWLLAAIRLSNPRFPVPDAHGEAVARNHAAILQALTDPQQQSLRSLVEQLLRQAPELDMKRWAAAVDFTADRIGFVLGNSLAAAVAVVRASPPESSHATERDRLRELYLYSVSPEYLALRRAMGIQIG